MSESADIWGHVYLFDFDKGVVIKNQWVVAIFYHGQERVGRLFAFKMRSRRRDPEETPGGLFARSKMMYNMVPCLCMPYLFVRKYCVLLYTYL